MTDVLALWERMALDPLNRDRARASTAPVLHLRHPDVLVLGYSVWTQDGLPLSIEADHVVRSSHSTTHPEALGALTTTGPDRVSDPRRVMRLHARNFLSNMEALWSGQRLDRAAGQELDAEVEDAESGASDVTIAVNGERHAGSAFSIRGSTFVRVDHHGGQWVWTVAGPTRLALGPFTTAVDS
jgi:hypothetical protein